MKITVGGSSNEKLEFCFFFLLQFWLLTESQVFRQPEESQNLSSETMLFVYPKEQSQQFKVTSVAVKRLHGLHNSYKRKH